MAIRTADAEARVLPRALAGATVLQIVPALRRRAAARTTVDIAHALVRPAPAPSSPARDGALVNELKSFGGEWLPFANATVNPLRLRRNAEALSEFIAVERVDIVHAKNPGAAWSAMIATDRNGVPLVTDLPDLPPAACGLRRSTSARSAGGDRVIARSLFNARPMIERYRHSGGAHRGDAAQHRHRGVRSRRTCKPERVAALRHVWGIPSGVRIVLVPGPVAPWNGQIDAGRRPRACSSTTACAA